MIKFRLYCVKITKPIVVSIFLVIGPLVSVDAQQEWFVEGAKWYQNIGVNFDT